MKLVKKDWAGRKFAFHDGKVEVDSAGMIDVDQKEKEAIDILVRMGFKPVYNRPEKLETPAPVEKVEENKSEEKTEAKPEEEKPAKFMGSFKKKKGRVG
jgi:hypothetical protein